MLSAVPGVVAIVTHGDLVSRIFFCRSSVEATRQVELHFPGALRSSSDLLAKSFAQFVEYFQGSRYEFQLPLDDTALTPFSRKVHATLRAVPYGTVVSYGQLALLSGHPRAARAVGRVMSTNPFPLLIPCHRVIAAGGRLGLYTAADGAATKDWLIKFESSHVSSR